MESNEWTSFHSDFTKSGVKPSVNDLAIAGSGLANSLRNSAHLRGLLPDPLHESAIIPFASIGLLLRQHFTGSSSGSSGRSTRCDIRVDAKWLRGKQGMTCSRYCEEYLPLARDVTLRWRRVGRLCMRDSTIHRRSVGPTT